MEGEPKLFVDKPPVDNPAALSSAPVQLAEQLAHLFDTTEEEILVISAYLIPTADFDVRIVSNTVEHVRINPDREKCYTGGCSRLRRFFCT